MRRFSRVMNTIRVAILDLYEGQPNQGMRCIRQILQEWSEKQQLPLDVEEFDVRQAVAIPDLNFDIYISSGGPGSPLPTGAAWEASYSNWIDTIVANNENPRAQKKHVFFICHSFQLACKHFGLGEISRRNSTAFGVFPVHVTIDGQRDPVFEGLRDPFYVVDSRDFQVTLPDFSQLEALGTKVLCIEKYRPHVPLPQAIMGVRFNEFMVGTQFHPEADATGMSMYLQKEDKKKTVIENHGEDKWKSMVEQLNDPDKIMWTYATVIPNFLSQAAHHLLGVTA